MTTRQKEKTGNFRRAGALAGKSDALVALEVLPPAFYPWTEFVRTKDGTYAAIVPNPDRPQVPLREDDPMPPRFLGRRVERTDQLFHSVVGEPTLRLVLGENDIPSMVEHGYWVAELRGRL